MSIPVISSGSDDGGLFPRLFRGPLGSRGLQCRVLGGDSGSFFWMGWETKEPRSMEFEFCSRHVSPSNRPKIIFFMFCIICFWGVFIFIRIKKGEGQGKEGVTLKL